MVRRCFPLRRLPQEPNPERDTGILRKIERSFEDSVTAEREGKRLREGGGFYTTELIMCKCMRLGQRRECLEGVGRTGRLVFEYPA